MDEREFIDKKAFLKEIVKICDKECGGKGELCDNCKAYRAYEILDKMPAVKAVPIEDGRYIKAGEVSVVVEDGEPVGFYRPDGPEESESEHRAEVFERMAFKLGEEQNLLSKFAARIVGCGWCVNHGAKTNQEPCRSCGILRNNFSPDFNKIRKEAERI